MDMSGSISQISIVQMSTPKALTSPNCQEIIEDLSDRDPLIPCDRLSILVVKIDAVHELSINIELLVKGSCIANSDRSATSVAGEMTVTCYLSPGTKTFNLPELNLRDVRLATNSEHDWKCSVRRSRLSETITHEHHIGVSFFRETHSQENVYGKAGVSNPGKSIIPIPVHKSAAFL